MTGWQRFFLLIVFCAGVLILWPQYDGAGVSFLITAFVLWTCLIILLSVLISLFAIDKLEFLHRIISLAFVGAMGASLLLYFPLKEHQTPWTRLKQHAWPTGQDIRTGLKRLNFHVDFLHRTTEQNKSSFGQAVDRARDVQKTLQQSAQQWQDLSEKLEENK